MRPQRLARLPRAIARPVVREAYRIKAQLERWEFRRRRAIFVHIPKSGGISVRASIFPRVPIEHATAADYEEIFGNAFWRYLKFAFVRNPYSRLASAYHYLAHGGHPDFPDDRRFADEVLGNYSSFDDFVVDWLRPGNLPERPHFLPQTHFVTLDQRNVLDFTGRFESLERDFHTVCGMLGLGRLRLEHRNPTPGVRPPLADFYRSDEVVRIVREVYASDFDVLGYATRLPES